MPDQIENDEFLSSKSVRARYDGISAMCLWRWLRDPDMDFPQPTYIGRRRYWRAADLRRWERSRPRGADGQQAGAA